ncbi:hypothetical protein QE152_g5837 [Popillia japonica]|uniref:Uncharacterized protein n=1 Tax=Popillia japonica TaxID=7064 RepID=A0AAW1MKC2_POPJA
MEGREEDRMIRKIKEWRPMVNRKEGRPKLRWEDQVLEDMRKLNIPDITSKEDEEEDIIPLSQLVERLRDKETEELLVELRRDFQRLRKTCELNRTPEAKQKVITD